jgi:DNA-directed RNA polymerase subunit RPC12/RpoP
MKATVKCANCGQEYVYYDEAEQSNVTGTIQKECPFCTSNAIK